MSATRPRVLIDGVFFQMYKTGIARVWQALLAEWAATDFGPHVVLLDRGGTAPRVPGIRTRGVPAYDYARTDDDRRMLQVACDEEGAGVFCSTYYTTPLGTPSVFMAHDMIPELAGWDLSSPMWREKHHGIRHAAAFVCVSHATRRDLLRFFPDLPADRVHVTPLAAARPFHPRPAAEVEYVRRGVGMAAGRPYVMTVGARGGYKNTELTFRALASLVPAELDAIEVLCAGFTTLEPEYQAIVPGKAVRAFNLSDDELAAAYTGAAALLHPSAYEGFGLPVVEAMACGCPVVTTANGSLAEVAGDAAIVVGDRDAEGMAAAIRRAVRGDDRAGMAARGVARAATFSWARTADAIRGVLVGVAAGGRA